MDGSAEASGRLALIPDHFDGRQFFNPHVPRVKKRLRAVHRWQRTRQKERWPAHVEDTILPPPDRIANDRIAVTFIGHSTFLLQIEGVCVLTDPIWSKRCSPVSVAGPRRVRRPGQSLDALPSVDLLLVSHNHYDHMDLPTLRKIQTRWSPCAQLALATSPSCEGGVSVGSRTRSVSAPNWPARVISCRPSISPHAGCAIGTAAFGVGLSSRSVGVVYFAGNSGYCPHFTEWMQVSAHRSRAPSDWRL